MLSCLATYHLAPFRTQSQFIYITTIVFVHITLNVNTKSCQILWEDALKDALAWTPFIIKAFICITYSQELVSEVFKTSKK